MATGYVVADGKGTAGQVLTSQGTGSPASWASYSAGALGYYGAFYDTTTTFAALADTAYQVPLGSTFENNGVTLSSNNMVFSYGGTYSITVSIQLANTSTSNEHTATLWFRLNGSDLSNSASIATIPKKGSGVDGKYIMTVNIVQTVAAGDNICLWWSANIGLNTVSIQTITASPAPTAPATIATATQVTYVQNGPSGSFDYGKAISASQGWFMP